MSDERQTPAGGEAALLRHFLAYLEAQRATSRDHDAVIDAYLAGSGSGAVFTLTAEIDTLLRRGLDDAALLRELQAGGLTQLPTRRTACGWLRDVRHRLAQ